MELRKRFESIARKHIKRNGIEKVLEMLAKSDFYTAPASTKYHDSVENGLVLHSLKVFSELDSMCTDVSMEKKAIVALFHDICKIYYYTVEMRNKKGADGKWFQEPYYSVKDQLPLGHGEKSVIMLMQLMPLEVDEIMAIRWHMGGYEPSDNYKYMSEAYNEFPLAVYLHLADMKASYIK